MPPLSPPSENPSNPWKVWVKKVEERHRIRVPRELCEVVNWLPADGNTSITCFTIIGPMRQVQLVPKHLESPVLEKMRATLLVSPPLASEIGASWLEFLRYAATSWSASCSFDAKYNRFTIQLPKEARDLALVPHDNEVAVIFGTGEILEIWKPTEWLSFAHSVALKGTAVAQLASDALQDRTNY